MGSNGTGNPIFGVLLAFVAASLLLAVIGFILHRRGLLRARGPALAWAILSILPLFGGGIFLFTKHRVEMTQGVVKPGVNSPNVRSAP